MNKTVQEAAKEARMTSAETLTALGTHTSLDDFTGLSYDEIAESAFVKGAEWKEMQSPWISTEDKLPDDNQKIIILDDFARTFEGTYCNGAWFYATHHFNEAGLLIECSFMPMPEQVKPVAWMPVPPFNGTDIK